MLKRREDSMDAEKAGVQSLNGLLNFSWNIAELKIPF
jgi:hypothetical protein